MSGTSTPAPLNSSSTCRPASRTISESLLLTPRSSSQAEAGKEIELGALVRVHDRGLVRGGEREVQPSGEDSQPDAAAVSGVPPRRALAVDEHASDVGQPVETESPGKAEVELAERDLHLRVPDHRGVAGEPVQVVTPQSVPGRSASDIQGHALGGDA